MKPRLLPWPWLWLWLALLVAIATPAGAADTAGLSAGAHAAPWVRSQIAAFESRAASQPATAISRIMYRGQPAYLLASPCCDLWNYLYAADGSVLCAPSGGFTGQGDGRCPEVRQLQRRFPLSTPMPPAPAASAPTRR